MAINKKSSIIIGTFLTMFVSHMLFPSFAYFVVTAFLVLAGSLYFYKNEKEKGENYKTYNLTIVAISFIALVDFAFSFYTFFAKDNIVFWFEFGNCMPFLLFAFAFLLTAFNHLYDTSSKTGYAWFVAIGVTLAYTLYPEDWLGAYIKYWLFLEVLIFSAYYSFGFKIPYLDKLYETAK